MDIASIPVRSLLLLLYAVVFSGMPLVNFAVPFFILCSFSVNFGTCSLTFHGKTCKIELFPEGSKPSFIQSCNHKEGLIMNLSRRNFIKIAGLSAAAVAGAALFTGCSGQILLPVQFTSDALTTEQIKKLDTAKFTVLDGLSEDAQKKMINTFVKSQLHLTMYEVDFIERKTSPLDGKETDYLLVTLKLS